MKIENDSKLAEVQSVGIEKSMKMGINTEDMGILQMILSKGLYSDPIGSLIREYSSNALDATREANSKEPIIVSLKPDERGDYWFKVQDFGIGISPDRADVIKDFAASTKRGDNDQLGYFGLGIKSGLSYSESINIESNFNGTKYHYLMHEGEKEHHLDLLYSIPTEEKNGTIISIKLLRYYDSIEFRKKIMDQLCYFEGIYFDIPAFDNDFKIIDGGMWKYSEMSDHDHIHLCLDNVYYALDFEKLGISPVKGKIALNFKISDGLIPTPNREQIRMTPKAKELITNRLREVADYFVKKYNESVVEIDNFFDIFGYLASSYALELNISPDTNKKIELDLSNLTQFTNEVMKTPSMKGIKYLDLYKLFNKRGSGFPLVFDKYYARATINKWKRRLQTKEITFSPESLFLDLLGNEDVYVCNGNIGNVTIDYLKDSIQQSELRILGVKLSGCYKTSLKTYKAFLQLNDYPKSEWRDRIKEFQIISNQILSRIKDFDDIKIPQEWLDERKNDRIITRKKTISKIQINPKYAQRSGRNRSSIGFIFPIEGVTKTIGDLSREKSFTIYFKAFDTRIEREHANSFAGLILNRYEINKKRAPIKVALLSERDWNKLEKNSIHNWIKFEDFMKGKHKSFGRMCTSVRVKEFLQKYSVLISSMYFIKLLDSELFNNIRMLENYIGPKNNAISINMELNNEMLDICEKLQLWDYDIILQLEEAEKSIKKFDFVELLKISCYEKVNLKNALDLSIEICKNRKIKLNLECYNNKTVINEYKDYTDPDSEDEDEILEIKEDEQCLEIAEREEQEEGEEKVEEREEELS